MDEKIKANEIKAEYQAEFDKTLKMLMECYPRISRVKKDDDLTKNVFDISINSILIDILKQIQIDCNHMTIHEFHKKYVPNLPILYRWDFTCAEFKEIIDSSYLTERDKKIATKFFIEKKSITDVYNELTDIGDRKTIPNNLDKINDALLHRACLYNKNN